MFLSNLLRSVQSNGYPPPTPWLAYLFRAKLHIALPQLAWSASDDCVAEHSDDHHKEEVTGVHKMQID